MHWQESITRGPNIYIIRLRIITYYLSSEAYGPKGKFDN